MDGVGARSTWAAPATSVATRAACSASAVVLIVGG
jgi:hypothetical protein